MTPNSDSSANLRQKAEARVQTQPLPDISALSTEEVQRLFYELQVHQIELEMQNDELLSTQVELEASRDKYIDLYDFAPVAYFTVGKNDLIEAANLAGATLLGMDRRTLIGQPLSHFVSAEYQDAFYLNRKRTLETHAPQICEINMMRADHTLFYGELKSLRVQEKDTDKNKYRVAISDITKRVMAEKELHRTSNLESLGFLAGGIAHDFNNILTVVFANLQILQSTLNQNTAEYECVSEAWEATLKTKNLTAQLLTFATGGTPFKEVTAIETIIKQTTQLSLSGSHTKPEYHFSADLLAVHIDVNQINRVIQNIVINASQAMPNGGILSISAENVVLPAQNVYGLKEGNYIKVRFTDRGSGMSEEICKHIFDPYFTTKQAGHGLGLSIVYSILSRHEGHITVQSQVDKGTTFEVFLPATTQEIKETEKTQKPFFIGTAKILLMDDDDTILKTMRRILERLGYTVDTTSNGTQALQAYQTALKTDNPYHIVIMDLTIPGDLGGEETIAQLLQHDPDARVIVTSGYANNPVMANFKKHGFKARIHKPIDLVELTETITQVLRDDS